MNSRRRLFTIAFALLLLLRAMLCFYGYDRRPLVSSNDEVVIQDAALSWARGEGLRLTSFEGLELSTFYAHYPPLYTLTQAALYHTFGFSVAVIRLPGIIYSLTAVLFVGGIMLRWRRARMLDDFAVVIAGGLLVVDPFFAILSRVGRMEPLGMMLGTIGIFCTTNGGGDLLTKRRSRWILAALFIGLALATHVAAVAYWIMFLALLVNQPRPLRWKDRLAFTTIPLAVLALLWVAVYRERSFEGIHQMLRISRWELPLPSFGLKNFVDGILHSDLYLIKKVGGTAFVIMWTGWLLAILRPLLGTHLKNASSRLLILMFAIVALTQIIIGWKLSLYVARTFLFVPLATLLLAAGISNLSRPSKRIVLCFSGCFAAVQLLLFAAYFRRLPARWQDWSPDRFDRLVASIPADTHVLSTYELWHAFMKANRPVRVTDFALISDIRYFESDPRRLATYDVAILNSATRKIAEEAGLFPAPDWSQTISIDDDQTFWIMKRIR